MRIVVLGAGGGVGRAAVTEASARGHEVVAVARTTATVPEGSAITRVTADVRDAAAVGAVLDGAHAVLWCVGVTKRSGGDVGRASMPGVVSAMDAQGVSRLVSVSGAGVTLTDDDKPRGARLVSALTRLLARDLVEDKQGEHDTLAASDLAWTEVRPPRLVERPAADGYRLGAAAPGVRAAPVPKATVARAMVDLAESGDWPRASPFLTLT